MRVAQSAGFSLPTLSLLKDTQKQVEFFNIPRRVLRLPCLPAGVRTKAGAKSMGLPCAQELRAGLLLFLLRRHSRRDLIMLAPVLGGFCRFADLFQMCGQSGEVVKGAFVVAFRLPAMR